MPPERERERVCVYTNTERDRGAHINGQLLVDIRAAVESKQVMFDDR